MSLCAHLDRDGADVRSLEDYALLSRHLVAAGLPMIIFVDEPALDHLKFMNSYDHIKLIPLPENILSPKITEKVGHLLSQGRRSPRSTNPQKDTSEYYQLMYLKPWLVEIASQIGNSDTLWWVDLGVAHVSDIPPDFKQRIYRTEVAPVLLFRDLRPGNRTAMWSADDGLGFACGGLFGVKREAASWFVEKFEQHLHTMLAQGSVPLDEEVFTKMTLRHPEVIAVRNAWHQQLFIGLS